MAGTGLSTAALSHIAQAYDALADSYDATYHDAVDLAENAVVRDLMPYGESMVDLGCGTGLGLQLTLEKALGSPIEGQMELAPLRYLGIDISKKMIERARKRFGGTTYAFVEGDMLTVQANDIDVVLSLFGSPNYADFDQFCAVAYEMLRDGGQAFLMPFTAARYKRHRQIAMGRYTKPVDQFTARRAMERAGFESVVIQNLSDRHSDAIAKDVSSGVLRRVLRERLDVLVEPYYLCVRGHK